MRLIDADKLMLSLNDNYLATSPTGNETLAVQDYRESMCEGLEIAMATVEGAPTVGGWISVKDRLPDEENQSCWVWCADMKEPDIDSWEGHRGETGSYYDDTGKVKLFIKSGWYYNDVQPITHWMPIRTPEPPKEVSGDA